MKIKTVDHSLIKVSQLSAATIFIIAFLLNRWEVVAGMSGVFLLSGVFPKLGPFALFYRFILIPLNIIQPDLRPDTQEAHRFAQLIGVPYAAISAYLIYAGYTYTGWGLVGSMIGLAFVSISGWCIGCYFYYLLNKAGLGGFFKYGPTDKTVFMGSHPKRVIKLE